MTLQKREKNICFLVGFALNFKKTETGDKKVEDVMQKLPKVRVQQRGERRSICHPALFMCTVISK